MSLEPQELQYLKSKIKREPTKTELNIIAAEWSEHCSYKSSKKHLKKLPMTGPLIIKEKGYDSGILDVGDQHVITIHIESHNHPSAVEPYGGAATGVGGVIRDILSTGTRPIAILNGLRFGNIQSDAHARWLFRNAVAGIADYGNCLGIPTVGGEVEFDESYTNYALVDVAAIGFGKKSDLIKNHAEPGDCVVLLGGTTGRDGVGGSQFASDALEDQDRSAVQIPDPFIEKLIIEAVLEARNENAIHAIKDLGGGGLACAISETADSMGIGIQMDVNAVHTKEQNMSPQEIMISESQERMLVITSKSKLDKLQRICSKYNIQLSVIGQVTATPTMEVKKGSETLALMPTEIVANAQLLDRPSKKPGYLNTINQNPQHLKTPIDLTSTLLNLLISPNIASKIWVYSQYDHEVGIRTVLKPGQDASVLRLDSQKFLAIKMDANPKHCYLDPYQGTIGCFEEACRNVVCTGADPIGMVDHLQFGNPEDPEIFWTFLEALKGIIDFAKYFNIPCVGGKVSLYNETSDGPIKPTPVIGVVGLINNQQKSTSPKITTLLQQQQQHSKIQKGDIILVVGVTHDELGGSEYYEHIHKFVGGKCPAVNFAESKSSMAAVLELAKAPNLLKNIHDCSKGGFAVAISELCMTNKIGCKVYLQDMLEDITVSVAAASTSASLSSPPPQHIDKLLFSESHSRYILVVPPQNKAKVENILQQNKYLQVKYSIIGQFEGPSIQMYHDTNTHKEGGNNNNNANHDKPSKAIIDLDVNKAQKDWLKSLEEIATNNA